MGSLLLMGGPAGKRLALPEAKILIHQPSGCYEGQAADIEIHAREVGQLRARIDEIYAGTPASRASGSWSATGTSARPKPPTTG